MNRKYLSTTIFGAALLLFAACTNDELTDGTDALPEGMYPLEIASVTMEAESSAQPWGVKEVQTRVSENEDGTGSVWNGGDDFYVKFQGSDKVGIYKIIDAEAGTADVVTPVYWQSASTEQTIIAWYAPQQEGTIDVSNQKDKLAYVIRAEQKATYNNGLAVGLNFEHRLAKVRVALQGNQADKVTDVKIKSLTSCTHTQGTVSGSDAAEGWITMKPVTYNNVKYWEANVVPDHPITEFQVNGKEGKLNNDNGITPEAAKVNTITLDVNIEGLEIEGNTYIVSSATALRAWGEAARENLSLNCTLAADIALTGTDNWTPVGPNDLNLYTGTFDGAGHTISGLNIEVNASDVIVTGGLIGALGKEGIVKNLTVTNANIGGTNSEPYGYVYVGGIVGQCMGGTISGCGFYGNVAAEGQTQEGIFAGGIVGYIAYNLGYPTITGCWSVIKKINAKSNYQGAIAGSAVNTNIGPCYYDYGGKGLGYINGNGSTNTDNTQKVDGTDVTWKKASEEMNKVLTGYKWVENTGDDKGTVPLVLEKIN